MNCIGNDAFVKKQKSSLIVTVSIM